MKDSQGVGAIAVISFLAVFATASEGFSKYDKPSVNCLQS